MEELDIANQMFRHFERNLSSHYQKANDESLNIELKELKEENEAQLLRCIALNDLLRTAKAANSYLNHVHWPRKNSKKRPKTARKKEIPPGKDISEIAEEVYMDVVKAADKEYTNNVLEALLTKDENGNEKPTKFFFDYEKPLTRKRRKVEGGALIDARKFFMCLICGPKHMDYSEKNLKSHYDKSHNIQLGPGPLPVTLSQLMEPTMTDQQQSAKCHICKTQFKNGDDLRTHKSLHINPKFCRHKCSSCPQAFVLEDQLKMHKMICQN